MSKIDERLVLCKHGFWTCPLCGDEARRHALREADQANDFAATQSATAAYARCFR
jgi:hypothetical protein